MIFAKLISLFFILIYLSSIIIAFAKSINLFSILMSEDIAKKKATFSKKLKEEIKKKPHTEPINGI
jgi:hypothetical protein